MILAVILSSDFLRCYYKSIQVKLDICVFWSLKCKFQIYMKGSKERLFMMTQTHNLPILVIIPFVKLQNDMQTTVKWWRKDQKWGEKRK